MTSSNHIFITPWFNTNEAWSGFRVQTAGGLASLDDKLVAMFDDPSVATMDHGLLWFIPIDIEQAAQWVAAVPAGRAVFLVTQPENGAQALALEKLRDDYAKGGRKFGLVVNQGLPLPAYGSWDYLLLTTEHARTLPMALLPSKSSRTRLAVSGVRTRAEHEWVNGLAGAISSGEYLFTRGGGSQKPDMARAHLLKLLALVVEDADTREIEEVFRQEPKLSYSLLRLVNSAAMAPRSPITSFSQAINILGRRQLQRWLQLLVYADANRGQAPSPLLVQAAVRGRLMELLAQCPCLASSGDAVPDVAFMTGAFSLLDVLLNMSMQDILMQLPLPEAMSSALAEHIGFLGQLIEVLAAVDQQNLKQAGALLDSLGIDPSSFLLAQLNALNWASKIQL